MPGAVYTSMSVVISRDGKQTITDETSEANFYKVCGFRTPQGFSILHTWEVDDERISIYGKRSGKSGNVNQFELPPPMDNTTLYGKVLLVCRRGNEVVSLALAQWKTRYELLFGGFEDLASEPESEDSEEGERTKEGYLKDGFVVSDSELEEEDYL